MRKFLALLSLSFALQAQALEPFQAPALTGPIVDQVGVINRDQYANLDAKLRALSESGKAQVAVLVASSLQGLTIEEYGIKLAEAWKLGAKTGEARDRSAIFIIAPNDRKMRIEVGYGLEGDVPDATASRILEQLVKPEIQRNRMSDGIYAGVNALTSLANGEAMPEPAPRQSRRGRGTPTGPAGNFVIVLIFLFLMGIFRNPFIALLAGTALGFFFLPAFYYGTGLGLLAFLLSKILPVNLGSGGRGGFGGGGFGGGGFGGGGGGFSGGGGSFGGGGSSSSW